MQAIITDRQHDRLRHCFRLPAFTNQTRALNIQRMPPLDKLILRGLRLYARHGVHKAEQALGQHFLVDIDLHADLSTACHSDRYEDTLDYVRIFDIARHAVQRQPTRNLVEKVAHDIATALLCEVQGAQRVRVRLVKPCVALPAVIEGGIGVEIERVRERR